LSNFLGTDKGEFALEPGIELTLRWNNAPYTPIAIDFNQAQKAIGWDLGKMENEAMAALIAQGLTDYSCQKADRNKLCGVSGGSSDGLFSLTVNAVPSNSTIKIMNISPKYTPGIRLKPGKDDVLAQRSGYKTWRKWITLDSSDMTLDVELQSPYSCDKKYCKNMTNCAEARYQLTVCGYGELDRDGDGIPCENVCGR